MSPSTDNFGERAAELGAHRAIEDEVDCTVDDDRSVPDVTQGDVDIVKYTPVNTAKKREKTLRQLDDDEAQHHGD